MHFLQGVTDIYENFTRRVDRGRRIGPLPSKRRIFRRGRLRLRIGVVANSHVQYTGKMKRRIVRVLQKYLLNPPVKMLFSLGLGRPGYALLETIGRKTGKPRRTPVGDGRIGRQFWIVAEHGIKAGYVLNITHNPRVRLRLRDGLRSRWHSGTAHLLPKDDPRERQRWLADQVPGSAMNARLVRLFGTQLLTIRIDLDS